MGDDRPRGIRYNASPQGNEEILAARLADGGMAMLSGMGQEDGGGPHPLPIGWVRPEDAPEIARVTRLLALPGALTLPPLWTALLPSDEDANDEGQAILSLDIGGPVGGRMRHPSWFLLFINLPELLPGFIDVFHARFLTIYTHEPVLDEDPALNPSFTLSLQGNPGLRAALGQDPLVMPDRIIAAYRRRGVAP